MITDSNTVSDMHWALHTESTIDGDVGEAWSLFRDIRRWYPEYSFELVSGPPYLSGVGLQEGQVLRVAPTHSFPRVSNSEAPEFQFFIQETLKIVPQVEIVVLLSGGPAYDLKRYTQFYVWKLTGSTKQTTITVDSYGEAELIKPLTQVDFAKYYDELNANFFRSWSEAFVSLKQILDKER